MTSTEPPVWLTGLVQTLADLALVLAEANVEQGTQTQEKLDELTELATQSLAQQGAILVAAEELNAALDALGQKIIDEFAEIAAKVDALEASGGDVTELRAAVDAATARVQGFVDEVGGLSTAGDDAPAPPA